MPLSITYDNKAFEKGEPLELYGVLFENGKSKEMSEEEETRFVQLLGAKPSEAFKNSEQVKVSGSMSVKLADVVSPEPVAVSAEGYASDESNDRKVT